MWYMDLEYIVPVIISVIIQAIIFGYITKYISNSKGYSGGFWWGFWLSVIGILVVGFRPDNRQQYQASSPTTIKTCSNCGAKLNAQALKSKQCPKCLSIIKTNSQNKLNSTNDTSLSSNNNTAISTLEQLAKLHNQGIITDEEFQQKKSEILAKM